MWFIRISAVSGLSVQVFLPHPMKITGLIESYYGQWSNENVIRKRGRILKVCGIFKVWMVKRNSIQRRCGVTPYDPQGREWQVIVSVSIYFCFFLKFSVPPPKKKQIYGFNNSNFSTFSYGISSSYGCLQSHFLRPLPLRPQWCLSLHKMSPILPLFIHYICPG